MADDSSIRYEEAPVLQSVCAYGSETLVPRNDICRFSYYLKCCVIGCGINIGVDKELLDYMNAHHLAAEQQEIILHYCFNELSLANLLNRAFILDDDHNMLPQGTLNTFFEFKTASTYFSIDTFLSIATGQEVYMHNVMLCTLKWMREYYIDPFVRYQRGNPLIEIHATPVTEDEEIPYAVGGDECDYTHQGVIVTQVDLPPEEDVTSPDHVPKQCCACHESIQLTECPFYRCTQCHSSEYCEGCYVSGRHDQTHVFERICRMSTESLAARVVETLSELDASFIPDVPMAVAIHANQLEVKLEAQRTTEQTARGGAGPLSSEDSSKVITKRSRVSCDATDRDQKPRASKRTRRDNGSHIYLL